MNKSAIDTEIEEIISSILNNSYDSKIANAGIIELLHDCNRVRVLVTTQNSRDLGMQLLSFIIHNESNLSLIEEWDEFVFFLNIAESVNFPIVIPDDIFDDDYWVVYVRRYQDTLIINGGLI